MRRVVGKADSAVVGVADIMDAFPLHADLLEVVTQLVGGGGRGGNTAGGTKVDIAGGTRGMQSSS